MVDESTFKDDPLRVLRLARFKAKLPDFKIEEKTMIQARAMVKDLPFLSKERIFNEGCSNWWWSSWNDGCDNC